jgi:hypothetical protein
MLRSFYALLVLAVVGTSQGCRICDSPYDYCGPVMPCGDSCGPGGCGHSHGGHSHGGYIDSGYSGGQGGCSSCGTGGGHALEYSHESEGGTIIQGQPTPAEAIPYQGSRPTSKSVMKPATKATYEAPMQTARSPYPVNSRGPIFW